MSCNGTREMIVNHRRGGGISRRTPAVRAVPPHRAATHADPGRFQHAFYPLSIRGEPVNRAYNPRHVAPHGLLRYNTTRQRRA